jgi:hypothetical protein
VALALVPKCPACWSVYAGLSSWLGLSIAIEAHYLLPLTCVSLGLAVGFLGLSARRARIVTPFLLGAVAAALVVIGKFAAESQPMVYAGLALLLAASFWSRRRCRPRSLLQAPGEAALRTAQ